MLWALAIVFFASCFTLYGSYIGGGGGDAGGPKLVVAKVNGEEIPRDLYDRNAHMAIRNLEQMAGTSGVRVSFEQQLGARGQAFEAIVDSYLKAQAAEKEGIQVSAAEVRKKIDEQVKEQMDPARLEGATDAEKRQFEQQLRQMFSEDLTRKQLLIEALDKKLRERFKPTEQDVINSYNEVKVRHILVKVDQGGKNDAAAKAKAEGLLAKIKGGADFATIAKQSSDDTSNKANGGVLPDWMGKDAQLVPEFKAAAMALKKGEVSPLVKTMFGYHIIKADDTRSKLPKDYNDPKKKEEYRAQVEEQLLRERKQAYETGLRVHADIDPVDPFIAGYMLRNEANGLAQSGDMKGFEKKIAEAALKYEEASKTTQAENGPALYSELAKLYNIAKMDDKALAAVTRALEYSKSAELYVTQGEIYERQKKKAEAVKAYEQAMEQCYDMPWQYTSLQLKFKTLGRDDLAKKAYGKWQDFIKRDDAKRKQASSATLPVQTGK
jgi:parvulin-like peptidyl-prolyl isomerase